MPFKAKKANIGRFSHNYTLPVEKFVKGEHSPEVEAVRTKYAHLEKRAFQEFNRRLKSHALTWHEWDAYLDRVIREEVLVSEKYAAEFDEWITTIGGTTR